MKKTQTLVQLTPDLLAALDQHSASTGRSRSDIIREAIRTYLEEVLDDEIDRKVVAGYRKKPQKADRWAEAAARESIAAEPW
jgi:metal-responsive CopG/Arc/MetJ family transcriptional regulator